MVVVDGNSGGTDIESPFKLEAWFGPETTGPDISQDFGLLLTKEFTFGFHISEHSPLDDKRACSNRTGDLSVSA